MISTKDAIVSDIVQKIEPLTEPGTGFRKWALVVGSQAYDAGYSAALAAKGDGWVDVESAEPSNSLQWLLIENRRDKERGIRLGVREESGWRIVDERGNSQWVPITLGVLAVMPLNPPTDRPYRKPETETGGKR